MSSLAEFLATCSWFNTLTQIQRQQVEDEVYERQYPAGSFVCRTNEIADAWIGVIEGLAVLTSSSQQGKPFSFIGVPTGGWFGEGTVLKNEPRKYDVLAKRDTRVACMPSTTFKWLYDNCIGFNHFLLGHLNERCGQFIGMVEADRVGGVQARVAQCLASLFNPVLYPRVGLCIDLTQEEIGFLCGLSRQSVNRALQVLEREGLLRREFRNVTVLDVEKLGRFIRAQY